MNNDTKNDFFTQGFLFSEVTTEVLQKNKILIL